MANWARVHRLEFLNPSITLVLKLGFHKETGNHSLKLDKAPSKQIPPCVLTAASHKQSPVCHWKTSSFQWLPIQSLVTLGSGKEEKHNWGSRWFSFFLALSKPCHVESVGSFYIRLKTANCFHRHACNNEIPWIWSPVYVPAYFCSCFNFSLQNWRHGVTHYITPQAASKFS